MGEPDQGGAGVSFVLELAELFAVGFEPAVEGEAEGAFDPLEVAAAVGDLGGADGDGPGAKVRGVDRGRGEERAAVAADQVGDGLSGTGGETVGHEPSIGSQTGFFNHDPEINPDVFVILSEAARRAAQSKDPFCGV